MCGNLPFYGRAFLMAEYQDTEWVDYFLELQLRELQVKNCS